MAYGTAINSNSKFHGITHGKQWIFSTEFVRFFLSQFFSFFCCCAHHLSRKLRVRKTNLLHKCMDKSDIYANLLTKLEHHESKTQTFFVNLKCIMCIIISSVVLFLTKIHFSEGLKPKKSETSDFDNQELDDKRKWFHSSRNWIVCTTSIGIMFILIYHFKCIFIEFSKTRDGIKEFTVELGFV